MSHLAALAFAFAWFAAWLTRVERPFEEWGDVALLVSSAVCLYIGLTRA